MADGTAPTGTSTTEGPGNERMRHEQAVAVAASFSGYERSTLSGGVSSHYMGETLTIRVAVQFFERVRSAAVDRASMFVSSAGRSLVLSLRVVDVASQRGSKRAREGGGDEGDEGAGSTKSARGAGGNGGDSRVVRAPSVAKGRFRLFRWRPTQDPVITTARRAAAATEPPVVIADEMWDAAQTCVSELSALRSADGELVLQKLVVSVDKAGDGARLLAQCPKLIVIARLASGLAVPVRALLNALPRREPVDGLLTTADQVASLRSSSAIAPTDEEATAMTHGRLPLCVVIGITEAPTTE